MAWGFPNRCACGARIRSKDKYCAYCGLQQPPVPAASGEVCEGCEGPLRARWKYCPECGEKRTVDVMKSGYSGQHVKLSDFKHASRILLLTDLHMTESATTPTLVGRLTTTNLCVDRILQRFAGDIDQLLVSGDLVDHGHVGELERFVETLEAHKLRHKTTVIPGNHDLVLQGSKRVNLAHFARMLEQLPGHPREEDGFPFVRHLGNHVVVIGLDSTGVGRKRRAAQILLNGRGRVDAEQLERLRAELTRIPSDVLKIVMTHHRINPMPHTHGIWKRLKTRVVDGWLMALDGAEELKALLTSSDNVLLVHGHHHVEHVAFPREGGLQATVGLPSSTHPDKFDGVYKLFMLVVQIGWIHLLRVVFDSPDALLEEDPLEHLRLVRSFELKRSRTPSAVQRALEKAGFQRDKQESDLLGKWATGGFGPDIAAILRRPAFLRTAEDRNRLRAQSLI